MENLKADIVKFLQGLIVTFLIFTGQEDAELTEDQIAGIETFVDIIFFL